ncbi:Oidioi.mRNA.OKI2018_I69.XSR.g15135.t1.cds [Oikopleura dioica]|uniref:Oidioi.mRNA.OKI2018_I69.XSR.g15135.t1.cds n=1 Tax=Oikopleura dioica TaxID=34765 RepID=A0ABN7SJ91_OIKDI|nr:Oidioi.mRNA.OKI2018_I69.XSR.g15135.t1.cds [Oikopleura dioica]
MPFTLSDREAFIQKMDHSFSETLRMRKEMTGIILRSDNIVRSLKVEKKDYGSCNDVVYDLLEQARSNRAKLEGILDRNDMKMMKF